ncbi:MAG: CapA family protein [Firmicutes bacterium]|nr:CapA family protein [Bacillota bacterium]
MEQHPLPGPARAKPVLFAAGFLLVLYALAVLLAWSLGRGFWLPLAVHFKNELSASPALTLVASGDVMLGRRVAGAMEEKGMFYPFARVAHLLQGGDLTFGNLESPLSRQGTPLPGKGIWFRGDPGAAVALKAAGYDVLSVANNHTLDYDDPAFLETLAVLRRAGIDPVGGGKNSIEAAQPVFKEANGYKVAFLAATEMADIFWSWENPRTLEATQERPGVAALEARRLENTIRSLEGRADLVVVSLHWGTEYSDYPTPAQREIAHRLVDAGADLIIGHHPHCLQGVELYRGSLIAYSLGNFVYDRQRRPKCQEGLLLRVRYRGPWLREALVYPVLIQNEQPRPAAGDAAGRILQRTAALTKKLGTSLEIADQVGIVSANLNTGKGASRDEKTGNS